MMCAAVWRRSKTAGDGGTAAFTLCGDEEKTTTKAEEWRVLFARRLLGQVILVIESLHALSRKRTKRRPARGPAGPRRTPATDFGLGKQDGRSVSCVNPALHDCIAALFKASPPLLPLQKKIILT